METTQNSQQNASREYERNTSTVEDYRHCNVETSQLEGNLRRPAMEGDDRAPEQQQWAESRKSGWAAHRARERDRRKSHQGVLYRYEIGTGRKTQWARRLLQAAGGSPEAP